MNAPTDIQLRTALDRTAHLDILERHFTTSGLLITVIHRNWIEAVSPSGEVIQNTYITSEV